MRRLLETNSHLSILQKLGKDLKDVPLYLFTTFHKQAPVRKLDPNQFWSHHLALIQDNEHGRRHRGNGKPFTLYLTPFLSLAVHTRRNTVPLLSVKCDFKTESFLPMATEARAGLLWPRTLCEGVRRFVIKISQLRRISDHRLEQKQNGVFHLFAAIVWPKSRDQIAQSEATIRYAPAISSDNRW